MSKQSTQAAFMQAAIHNRGKGATLTRERMKTTWRALDAHAKSAGWGKHVSPDTITAKQVRGFVRTRIADGLNPRTIQNEVSHLRRALAHREELQAVLTREELAVPQGTRIGEGRAIDPQLLAKARELADAPTRAAIDLGRTLGLRRSEIVRCGESLREWEKALAEGRSNITVRDGTKGGRIRDTFIAPQNRELALAAVRAARQVAEGQGGRMVKSESLEGATRKLSRDLAKVGLKGDDAGHGLRRAFAVDNYRHYLRQGVSVERTLQLLSHDLGHGDGRGRWVWNNYLKNSV